MSFSRSLTSSGGGIFDLSTPNLSWSNTSLACISPFRHFIAAAVITPSGAPPIPIKA
jgi:hypothetical protein